MIKNKVKNTTYTKKITAFGINYYQFFNLHPQYAQVYNMFQSGRFNTSALRRPAWDDVMEIIRLQKEIFDTLHSAIKTLKGSGKVSPDVDPFYATILIITTLESLIIPSPVLKKEMEHIKISKYLDFRSNYVNFINGLLKKD